jgi:hypothetical protein
LTVGPALVYKGALSNAPGVPVAVGVVGEVQQVVEQFTTIMRRRS